MKISIIGQGYVGLTLAISAANAGHQVIGFDVDTNLVSNLLNGVTFVPGIEQDNLKSLINKGLYTPSSIPKSIIDSKIFVLAVPTPLDNKRLPDLSYLELASNIVSDYISSGSLVVNESTSYPGTLRNFIKPIFDKKNKNKILFAVAPERVDPGNLTWSLRNTPRVISGLTEEAVVEAIRFYSTFCEEVSRVSSAEIAEASKLFENTFRQVNIALANEFSLIGANLGFSAYEAIVAASTKPFGFLAFYPSIGVGGHCIPVDPTYLSNTSKNSGQETPLIDQANSINLSMVEKIVKRIEKRIDLQLLGAKIQIIGIAYKVNVPDMRESPALELINKLRSLGALVTWHDPVVKYFEGESSVPLSLDIDLGLIVTPHDIIDISIWKSSKLNVLDLSITKSDLGWPKFL